MMTLVIRFCSNFIDQNILWWLLSRKCTKIPRQKCCILPKGLFLNLPIHFVLNWTGRYNYFLAERDLFPNMKYTFSVVANISKFSFYGGCGTLLSFCAGIDKVETAVWKIKERNHRSCQLFTIFFLYIYLIDTQVQQHTSTHPCIHSCVCIQLYSPQSWLWM